MTGALSLESVRILSSKFTMFPTFVQQNAFDHTGCLSPIMIETSEIKTSLARFQNLAGTQSVLCP